MPVVSYNCVGRLGNNLFQYFTAKLIGILFGHTYVTERPKNAFVINDSYYIQMCKTYGESHPYDMLRGKDIYLDGYFQYDTLLIRYRKQILDASEKDNDVLIYKQDDLPEHLRYADIFSKNTTVTDRSVTVHLRLDDFNGHGEVIPAHYYIDLLDSMSFDTLYIVCKPPTKEWEEKYLEHFAKYAPVYRKQTLLEDICTLSHSVRLLLSNSTLSWIIYYINRNNIRQAFVPHTHFHSHQHLLSYREYDIVYDVKLNKHSS